MECFIECILEILGELGESVLENKKVPRLVRILIYIVMAGAISALMFLAVSTIYEPRSAFRSVVATVLALGTIAFDIWGFIVVWNVPKNRDKDDE